MSTVLQIEIVFNLIFASYLIYCTANSFRHCVWILWSITITDEDGLLSLSLMSTLYPLVSPVIVHSLSLFLWRGQNLSVMRAHNVVAAVSRSTSTDSRFHSVHVPCLKAARGNKTKKWDDVCGWPMYPPPTFDRAHNWGITMVIISNSSCFKHGAD